MRFSKDHQWVETSGDLLVIGISAWQGEQLGDAVEVDLPTEGTVLKAGEPWAGVETADKTLELIAPVGGEVVELNARLQDEPELIDTSPEQLAWFVKIRPSDPKQGEALMDRDAYEAYLDSL